MAQNATQIATSYLFYSDLKLSFLPYCVLKLALDNLLLNYLEEIAHYA